MANLQIYATDYIGFSPGYIHTEIKMREPDMDEKKLKEVGLSTSYAIHHFALVRNRLGEAQRADGPPGTVVRDGQRHLLLGQRRSVIHHRRMHHCGRWLAQLRRAPGQLNRVTHGYHCTCPCI